MARKDVQLAENDLAVSNFNIACEYLHNHWLEKTTVKLRSCQAKVYKVGNFVILQSYDTLVASYDKENLVFRDCLRHEFGYTSTSAQHIAKFCSDYARGLRKYYRYYDVK